MKTVFIRAIEAAVDDKPAAVLAGARGPGPARFAVETSAFSQIPRSPFAYWASAGLLAVFPRLAPARSIATATVGMQSSDDFRFVGLWWERGLANFSPFAKGGSFSPYYADLHLTVNWLVDGHETKAFAETTPGSKHWSRNIRSAEHYFRPGLTWPRRTNGLSFRAMPAGCIFADKGPAAFVDEDDPQALLALCALLNSGPFSALVAVQLARTELAQSFEVGLIQQTPVPELKKRDVAELAERALRSWSLKRRIDTRSEISHAFLLPALLQAGAGTLAARADAWTQRTADVQAELEHLQLQIDDQAFRLYGISVEDRVRIEQGFGKPASSEQVEIDDDEDNGEAVEVDTLPMVGTLMSWSLGVAFGRFDLRLATGERLAPPEPTPFASLPSCSPAMLVGDDGRPIDSPPAGYPLNFPTNGILVDDPGHPRDLVSAVRSVFDRVFEESGSDDRAPWHEATEILETPDLRTWFARGFFELHIQRYSKSRRKAPIYWQLSTPSASYSVWIYILRATSDTLFRVLNDFVAPKLDHEKSKLDALSREAGPNPSAKQRRELEQQESFVDELQALRNEVARVAPLWRPNLDDGVILNFAPLWRLVPQSRSWQSECRKAWEKLASRDYDWAHIAMHLWPEHVVPKCQDDRSLAIAHGLERVFWFEDESGTWRKNRVDDATVRQLIAERTSTSVKAALDDLLSASTSQASQRRKSKGRSTASRPTPLKPAPAVPGARASDATLDESTLRAVKAAIAGVAEGAAKADILGATGLSDADWNAAIAILLDRGEVTRTGQKRGTRYYSGTPGVSA